MTTMMNRLKIKKIEWIDFVNASESEVEDIIERYDFHELDKEAILEENQTARVDTYDKYVFVVLHFPKYDTRTKRYLLNEFNIFVSKEFLISFRYYQSSSLERLFERYEAKEQDHETVNTAYMLYDVIDNMLDKVFRLLEKFSKDLRTIENALFRESPDEDLIREIMIRKRNIIALKHMMKPQLSALKLLELRMNTLFKDDDEVEVYYESLEDKLSKIYAEIELQQENIDTMEDTLKSIFDMRTGATMKYLTIFSAVMLPLTLITSFFGMNVDDVPFKDSLVYGSITLIALVMIGLTIWMIKGRKI